MKDLDIIKQLMAGNHLEPAELERAKHLVHGLNTNLASRNNRVCKICRDKLNTDDKARDCCDKCLKEANNG